MIVLFDIDGTLIRSDGVGRRALEAAFLECFGIEGALAGVRLAGNTDPAIVDETFAARLGRSPTAAEVEAVLDRYLARLEASVDAGAAIEALPGALALTSRLLASAAHLVGLATGNVARGAALKLRPTGLAGRFGFGGYGSDARERSDIVEAAIGRGQALAEARLGAAVPRERVVVIGDTEHDVLAARRVGARAVGVLAGALHPEALAAAAPDVLVDRLDSPTLLAALDLDGGPG